MSEAADAEREVEDFFNAEIFGQEPPPEPEPVFPDDAPPESKPVDEVAVDTPLEPAVDPEEGTPEGTEEAPDSEEVLSEQGEPETPEETPEDDHMAWARKQYGDDVDVEKLAKAAYEKEKLLGQRAEEVRLAKEERQQRELQERIDALNTPGVLTPEEDGWVDEAAMSGDPGEYAYDALQAGRPDLYAAVMDRWSTLGEQEARSARALHSQVMQLVSAPQPSEQESYTLALGHTFLSLGLDIDQHGPVILQKAEELGATHPAVQGMMSPDDDVRMISTRAIYDLIASNQTTVQKARVDDQVQARVKEEQLRQQAAGVNQGGPRVEPPKKSPFWEGFDEELAERGWDGNRPSYGKE